MFKAFAYAFLVAATIGVATNIEHSPHVMPVGWVAFCLSWSMWLGALHKGIQLNKGAK